MADLRQHLVASRIAGEVATSRQDNLRNIGRMLDDAPDYWFGLRRTREWTFDEAFDVMVRRCGIDADPEHVEGDDTIDPDLTLAALTRHRERLALAAERRERVLLATGHPTGLLAMHLSVAAALRSAGCEVLAVPLRGGSRVSGVLVLLDTVTGAGFGPVDEEEIASLAVARAELVHAAFLEGLHELVEPDCALVGGPDDRDGPATLEDVRRPADILWHRAAVTATHALRLQARVQAPALRRASSPGGTTSPP